MKKTTILVTGGAGYIGSFTAKELLDDGFNVVILDNLETGHKEAIDPRAILEICDLEDSPSIKKVFTKYPIEAVIDFAAYLAVGESMENPRKYLKNNVTNFINLLEVMRETGCKNIIKSSTAAIYGNPKSDDDFPLKENYIDNTKLKEAELLEGTWNGKKVSGEEFLQLFLESYETEVEKIPELKLTPTEITKLRIPTSIYGITKLIDEILLKKYEKLAGVNSVALRYFNVCGAAEDGSSGDDKPNPSNLMTMIIGSLLNSGNPLKIFGNDFPTKDGTGVRDYIHPLDLATGHLAALKYLLSGGQSEAFNLGNEAGYSVFDVIKSVEKTSGKKVMYEIVPRRSGDLAVSVADATKVKESLNWEAKYNLDDMARSAWLWHSKHPKGYASRESKPISEFSKQ